MKFQIRVTSFFGLLLNSSLLIIEWENNDSVLLKRSSATLNDETLLEIASMSFPKGIEFCANSNDAHLENTRHLITGAFFIDQINRRTKIVLNFIKISVKNFTPLTPSLLLKPSLLLSTLLSLLTECIRK